jgi:hypothetical protein
MKRLMIAVVLVAGCLPAAASASTAPAERSCNFFEWLYDSYVGDIGCVVVNSGG